MGGSLVALQEACVAWPSAQSSGSKGSGMLAPPTLTAWCAQQDQGKGQVGWVRGLGCGRVLQCCDCPCNTVIKASSGGAAKQALPHLCCP